MLRRRSLNALERLNVAIKERSLNVGTLSADFHDQQRRLSTVDAGLA
jgi:hypothetical protein